MTENDLKELFLRFYFDAIDVANFEKGIYEYSFLEDLIGVDDYIELISVDYNNRFGVEKAKKIVKRSYGRKYGREVDRDYANYVAEASLVNGADIMKGCEILSKLSIDYEYVDAVFCAYHDELQSHPDQLGFYKKRILNDLKLLLDQKNQ